MGRDLSLDYESEVYMIFRMIQFKKATAILREYVLSQINRLLVRLEISAKITLEGLLSPVQYENLQNDLLEGVPDLNSILKKANDVSEDGE